VGRDAGVWGGVQVWVLGSECAHLQVLGCPLPGAGVCICVFMCACICFCMCACTGACVLYARIGPGCMHVLSITEYHACVQGPVKDEDGGAAEPSRARQEGRGCLFLAHQGAGAYKVRGVLLRGLGGGCVCFVCVCVQHLYVGHPEIEL